MATGETGIIPAGAGRSFRPFQSRTDGRYHPRGCGEKMLSEEVRNGGRGSSPRVRGKDKDAGCDGECFGIIPAGAGKRSPLFSAANLPWDHPRGCGEKYTSSGAMTLQEGSSPRVRGKVHLIRRDDPPRGIIPAGAGKSEGDGDVAAGLGDHPRGCGEKPATTSFAVAARGSSPRVRGKVPLVMRRDFSQGIIPAGAGKS